MDNTSKGRKHREPVGSVRKSFPFTEAMKLAKWGILFDVDVVGPPVFDRRSRDEVLQLVFIPFVERLQLVVDVDEEVFGDQRQHVLVLRVDLSREKITGE